MRFKTLVLIFVFAVSVLLPLQLQAWTTYTLFTAMAATGTGNPIPVYNKYQHWSCDAILTGSPTAVSIRVEGNQGGALFGTTGMALHVCTATELTDSICSFSIANMTVVNVRGSLTALAGGVAPTVTLRCTGRE